MDGWLLPDAGNSLNFGWLIDGAARRGHSRWKGKFGELIIIQFGQRSIDRIGCQHTPGSVPTKSVDREVYYFVTTNGRTAVRNATAHGFGIGNQSNFWGPVRADQVSELDPFTNSLAAAPPPGPSCLTHQPLLGSLTPVQRDR